MTEAEQAGPDPLLGLNLAGKYKIVKLLGEGGMGCVYLGEQLMGTAVRKVAVKTLHRHLSMDPQIRARFSRECGTVAELEHPNTIQVYDFGTTEDGLLYIVMEFVQGRSLADILEKDGPMPADRVLDILGQVCGSLEEAHGRGIIHRDLKPDNVVLCEKAGRKDWVEVLDFGIAKRSTESDPNEQKLTQQGMVLGTPPYMSPEQFTGQPIKQTSDIYSLGVMTYEMLTGRLPFNGNTAWEWASQHMTAQPQPLEVQPNGNLLPPAMRSAIMRALEKSPDARFQTAGAFLEALKGNGAAVAAPGPSSGGGGRPKTEMASPMEMPPGMAAGFAAGPISGGPHSPMPHSGGMQPGTQPGTPMGGPGMGPGMAGPGMGPGMAGPGMGPGMGAPAPAAFVPPSQHQTGGARRGGGAGLYIGLGVGVLALVGVIIAAVAMRSGRKEDPTITAMTGAVLSSTPTTASSPTTAPSDEHHDNTPLSALNTPTAAAGGQPVPGGGKGGAGGGTVKPVPTPGKTTTGPVTTAKPPQVCVALRTFPKNHPAYQGMVAQCKAAGGTPP